jgi:hypothetical protein
VAHWLVEAFVLQVLPEIQDRAVDHRHWRISCAFLVALITISTVALPNAPTFADTSPVFNGNATAARVDDTPVQLAQANLPSLGGVDDYMHQDGDGPSTSAVPPNGYSTQPVPPQNYYPQGSQGYYPQGVPSQELNNGYANPNAARNALIGAAVVGALAVGLWAYQQHEMHQAQIQQAQQPVRRRFRSQHRAHNQQIE